MDLGDIWRLDATAQAELVRGLEVTPAELLETTIARIDALNGTINAVVTTLYELARQQAATFDPAAPFCGVPLLLKDACLQVEGTTYYLGLTALRDINYTSKHTTELAHRLRRAGFVFAGKTNVPELSTTASTEPRAFGPTRNPWDLTRTPGGSSGGSAAAVAAGMVSIAHGADGGGSLRYPAACCGAVTLKPSAGRVPSSTASGEYDVLRTWCEFALARSVRDLARLFDAVTGAVRGDVSMLHAAPCAATLIDRDPRPLRVGMLLADVMAGMSVDAECVAGVERTGRLLTSLGHHVDETHPAALDGMIVRLWPSLQAVLPATRAQLYRSIERMLGHRLEHHDVPEPLVTDEDLAKTSAAAALDALAAIADASRELRAWWRSGADDAGYDLLVAPVLRQPPWPLGGDGGAGDAGVFPFPFSLSGQPAMSLPIHATPSGLPVGVQLIAAYGRDELLLQVAAQLERAAPWSKRWPPMASD
jgi:amidase